MQHATGRVERPGESQEALDGKKMICVLFFGIVTTILDCVAGPYASFHCWVY